MSTKSLIVIPIAFAAGIVAMVLLQITGLVRIATPTGAAQLSGKVESSVSVSGVNGVSTTDNPSSADAGSGAASSLTSASSVEDKQRVAALSSTVDELRQQIQAATVQRDVMQGEIRELRESVESANSTNAFLPNGQSADTVTGAGGDQSNAVNAGEANQFNRRRNFGEPDSDETYASLVEAGIDPIVAAEIKQRSDQWSLQRLELIDQASREGWRRSEQFGDRMSELREERPDVRSELGDTDYDRYLYVSGEPNRVRIASIIDGSAAQLAGMEIGDLFRSYANERVFNSRELQRATREGSRGELVPVSVERSGQQLSLELPRGPLGVSLSELRVEPDGY